jgi:CRISPR system Cascade subunit CasD
MGTLLLKLAGPLQSWGTDGRFTERTTRHEPSKSGIVGLLAAALGRRRPENVADLASLRMGVRIDQPGSYERDFQIMHLRSWNKELQRWVNKQGKFSKLSNRYYLSDAVFVVGVEGDGELIDGLADALTHPAFPLFLGRRSCPPATKVLLDVFPDVRLVQALASEPWQATWPYRNMRLRRGMQPYPKLEIIRDEDPGEDLELPRETVRDVPLSFSPEFRQYGWRTVVHDFVTAHDGGTRDGQEGSDVRDPDYGTSRDDASNNSTLPAHDPWSALEG